jgi:F-type H+-transporting ATPase subunit c
MSPEVAKILAPTITIVLGAMVPAAGIAMMASKGLEAIGRNPEAADKIQGTLILTVAFVEAIAVYALVIALIVKFVA